MVTSPCGARTRVARASSSSRTRRGHRLPRPCPLLGTRRRGAAHQVLGDEGPVPHAEPEPLKAWQRDRADGEPAYTVANDATLREIVRRKPSSPSELPAIKGIGPWFIDTHAESLLELLGA